MRFFARASVLIVDPACELSCSCKTLCTLHGALLVQQVARTCGCWRRCTRYWWQQLPNSEHQKLKPLFVLHPGIVGFAKDFATTASFRDADTDDIFDLMRTGAAICAHAFSPKRPLLGLQHSLPSSSGTLSHTTPVGMTICSPEGVALWRDLPATAADVLGRQRSECSRPLCQVPRAHDAAAERGAAR